MSSAVPSSGRVLGDKDIPRERDGPPAADIPFIDRVRRAFQPGPRGVLGLVEDLLALSREQPLHLDYQDGQCHVRPTRGSAQEAAVIPLPKSVVRALLARIAALCNENRPGSVTPYGGMGELYLPGHPPTAFQVTFANTASEQRLELTAFASSISHQSP